MPEPSTSIHLTASQFHAALARAQGLPKRERSPVAALEHFGFVRTLGGIDVYLAVRARVGKLRRSDLDSAVAKHQLQVVPAVRGCIYLVPRREVAWALRTADLLSLRRREREHQKVGIGEGELEKVADRLVEVLLREGELTTDKLRRALPEGTVRSLGDAGKRVGISSTLPPALRLAEFDGRIERTLEGGRLDTERYLWRAAEVNPFGEQDVPEEPLAIYSYLAEIYFGAAGLGTRDDFASWAGIGKRDASSALEPLDLVPVEVDGVEADLLALASSVGSLQEDADDGSGDGAVSFLPFEDNLLHLQGGPRRLVDPQYHDTVVPAWGSSKPARLGDVRHTSFRSIAVGGRLAGFWEYDPDSGSVVTACFSALSPASKKRLAREAEAFGDFIRDDLGHGKSFSLDTDDAMRKRIAQLAEIDAR